MVRVSTSRPRELARPASGMLPAALRGCVTALTHDGVELEVRSVYTPAEVVITALVVPSLGLCGLLAAIGAAVAGYDLVGVLILAASAAAAIPLRLALRAWGTPASLTIELGQAVLRLGGPAFGRNGLHVPVNELRSARIVHDRWLVLETDVAVHEVLLPDRSARTRAALRALLEAALRDARARAGDEREVPAELHTLTDRAGPGERGSRGG